MPSFHRNQLRSGVLSLDLIVRARPRSLHLFEGSSLPYGSQSPLRANVSSLFPVRVIASSLLHWARRQGARLSMLRLTLCQSRLEAYLLRVVDLYKRGELMGPSGTQASPLPEALRKQLKNCFSRGLRSRSKLLASETFSRTSTIRLHIRLTHYVARCN